MGKGDAASAASATVRAMNVISRLMAAAGLAALTACASLPDGPSVMALPGTGRTFDDFRADDLGCRDYAFVQIGGAAPAQRANETTVTSAAVGTAIGAAIGAAAGGGGRDAATGAGIGMAMGALSGSAAAQGSYGATQQRYDNAYIQCMYAKGHRVPVTGHFESVGSRSVVIPAPPPPSNPPPPPPTSTR